MIAETVTDVPWVIPTAPDQPVTARDVENQFRALEFRLDDVLASERRRTMIMLGVSTAVGVAAAVGAVIWARR